MVKVEIKTERGDPIASIPTIPYARDGMFVNQESEVPEEVYLWKQSSGMSRHQRVLVKEKAVTQAAQILKKMTTSLTPLMNEGINKFGEIFENLSQFSKYLISQCKLSRHQHLLGLQAMF